MNTTLTRILTLQYVCIKPKPILALSFVRRRSFGLAIRCGSVGRAAVGRRPARVRWSLVVWLACRLVGLRSVGRRSVFGWPSLSDLAHPLARQSLRASVVPRARSAPARLLGVSGFSFALCYRSLAVFWL